MSEMERLKAKRRAHRSIVTRLINEAAPMMKGEHTDRIVTRLQTIDVQLEEKVTMLLTFDETLLSLIDIEEIKGDIMESELIKGKITQLQSEIVEFLNKQANKKETIEEHVSPPFTPLSDSSLDPERIDPPASTGSLPLTTSSIKPTVRTGTRPKLPKLHLPKFSGDITKFRTFWDSYKSAVHRNPELSPIDKFNYL